MASSLQAPPPSRDAWFTLDATMRRLLLPLLCLSLSLLLAPTVAQDAPPRPAAPQAVLEGRFATSLVCARCHSHSDAAQASEIIVRSRSTPASAPGSTCDAQY